MNHFKDKDAENKKRDIFSNINDNMFDRFIYDFLIMFDSLTSKYLIEDFYYNNFKTVNIFNDENKLNKEAVLKSNIGDLKTFPEKSSVMNNISLDKKEPLTEIIEGSKTVSITLEIPDVENDDLEIKINKNLLEININSSLQKFQKIIHLPCIVKEGSIKNTNKNGVLDIVLERNKKKEKIKGDKVNID